MAKLYITGVDIITQERKRHFDQEGWDNEHDDFHTEGQLADAAACYALGEDWRFLYQRKDEPEVMIMWPWGTSWWKPTPDDRIKELSKAGALIAAEIDRLLRIKNEDL